ncbi:MAG: hypothetical protein IH840_13090, partial [Candidatus Heimdallarchaeota archaeon]|nr:hypothetical protein [Candidatus Heimdallarchaeota archaeon]
MPLKHPKIDPRTAKEITEQVQTLLERYRKPSWLGFDPRNPLGVNATLIGIFSRFAEIVIERLNQVPEKNFLAFLDLLGASRLPPQPAKVPLTFSLAAGTSVESVVPIGTQVAAAPAEGKKEPVIFETERELVVTSAQLASIFVREPQQDKFAEHTVLVEDRVSPALLVFDGNRKNEHIFYIGHNSLFGQSNISELQLNLRLDQPLGAWLLFDLDLSFQGDLDDEILVTGLKQKFAENDFTLTGGATVEMVEEGLTWRIADKNRTFEIKKAEDKLNVFGTKVQWQIWDGTQWKNLEPGTGTEEN